MAKAKQGNKTRNSLDPREVKCKVCGQLVVVRSIDNRIAPHNTGWNPPIRGVMLPIRCLGGMKRAPKEN